MTASCPHSDTAFAFPKPDNQSAKVEAGCIARNASAPPGQIGSATRDDDRSSDKGVDQYYTLWPVAERLYHILCRYCDPHEYLMVEPSAGDGAFSRLLPVGSIAIDIAPRALGIITADFLSFDLPADRQVAVVGNPPFGRQSSRAIKFFNHAARRARVIGFVLPMSFRKASVQNKLDQRLHLVHEVALPNNAFLFHGRPFHVPAVFQIWERRLEPRVLALSETTDPDFEFVEPHLADFAIRRNGGRAGYIHHNFDAPKGSNYFIKGDVEAIMRTLDFASVVNNVAGSCSLAKCELVALYRARVGR